MLILTGYRLRQGEAKYRVFDSADYTEEWITEAELTEINRHKYIEFINSTTHKCQQGFKNQTAYRDATFDDTYLFIYRIAYGDWFILGGQDYSSFYYKHQLLALSDKRFHCVYFYNPMHLVFYSETEQCFSHMYAERALEDCYIPKIVADYYGVTQVTQQTNMLIRKFTKYSTNLYYNGVQGIKDKDDKVVYSELLFEDKLCNKNIMCRMFYNKPNEWFVIDGDKQVKFTDKKASKELGSVIAPFVINKIVTKTKECIKGIKLTKNAEDIGIGEYTAIQQRALLGYALLSELKDERKFIWNKVSCMDIRFHVDSRTQVDTVDAEYKRFGSIVVECFDENCDKYSVMRIPL